MNRVFILLSAVFLSSCATVMDGQTQTVRFETEGARQAECRLDTGEVVYKVNPPEEIIMMKTDEALEVYCWADGNRQKTVIVEPVLSTNTLLNIGTGFAPGFALDHHTNSAYIYPDVVTIDFTDVAYEKMPAPAHHNHPIAPPVDKIDQYKGGLPAIYPSDMEDPPAPRKRAGRDYLTSTPDSSQYIPPSNTPAK